MKRSICYIGFGSNLGDRLSHCKAALAALGRLPGSRLHAVSSLYETEPVCSEGAWFFNGVVEFSSSLTPRQVLENCQWIESQLGRERNRPEPGSPAAARTMDLDLLFYDDLILQEPDLEIPHPRMHERRFVLVPMAEIAPEACHPVFKKTVTELLSQTGTEHTVKKVLPAVPIEAGR